jgi:hypothetical protein
VNLEKYSKGKNKNIMKVEYNSKQLKIDSYKSSKIDPEELEQLQEQMRCFDEIEFKNRKKLISFSNTIANKQTLIHTKIL